MKHVVERCCHCGRNVSFGSGLFVNRVPELNDVATRTANKVVCPEGDFVCVECDAMTADECIARNKHE
jgi:hypothetical protein